MGIAWGIAVFDPVAQRDRLICESRATLKAVIGLVD